MQVRSLGREDPLEEGMATHSSILAWRIPWTEEPGRLQSMGSHRVGHNWSHLACTHSIWAGLLICKLWYWLRGLWGNLDEYDVLSPGVAYAYQSLEKWGGFLPTLVSHPTSLKYSGPSSPAFFPSLESGAAPFGCPEMLRAGRRPGRPLVSSHLGAFLIGNWSLATGCSIPVPWVTEKLWPEVLAKGLTLFRKWIPAWEKQAATPKSHLEGMVFSHSTGKDKAMIRAV